jgi:transcription-repair coupling factor (superfamily II helicase)
MGQTDDGRLTVRLIIQPKMTQKDWLKQLIVYVRGINQALNDADNDAKHDLKDKQEKSHDQERK